MVITAVYLWLVVAIIAIVRRIHKKDSELFGSTNNDSKADGSED